MCLFHNLGSSLLVCARPGAVCEAPSSDEPGQAGIGVTDLGYGCVCALLFVVQQLLDALQVRHFPSLLDGAIPIGIVCFRAAAIRGEHVASMISPYDGYPKDDLRESTGHTGTEDEQRIH
jgi:hypothetical protein